MEQKKALWIIVIVCLALLMISGVAIILYSAPQRGPALQSSSAVSRSANTKSPDRMADAQKIDPDSWVREPGTTPGLDQSQPPASSNINLTIVNGDNASTSNGTLDVSGLTSVPAPTAAGTPAETPPVPGQDAAGAKGATAVAKTDTGSVTATATAGSAAAVASASATAYSGAKSAPGTPKAAVKPATKQVSPAAPAVKSAPAKTVTVTEYWIQTGSFASKINAENAREALQARYLNADIFTRTVSGATTYRVRVGPYKSQAEAEYWLGTVKQIPDFAGSFVSQVKTKK